MSAHVDESRPDHNGAEPDLKRVMGPKLLLVFIVGDILGTGVYALTGQVAGEVGGAAWAPFLLAFVVATVTVTAISYLELVTRYPQAAGAALYTHKAFGVHFFTFLVAFTVMCSGITSASTAANAFAGFLNDGFGLGLPTGGAGLTAVALGKVHPTRRTPWVSIGFTTLIAFGLISYVVRASASTDGATAIALLGGTTSLLLLCVFTMVNVALLVLRRGTVDHDHFRAPAWLPVVGALTCAFLAGPWARSSEQLEQYEIAGYLLAVGIVLWLMTWLWNRGVRAKRTGFRDVDSLSG